jgi:hypothetical protein
MSPKAAAKAGKPEKKIAVKAAKSEKKAPSKAGKAADEAKVLEAAAGPSQEELDDQEEAAAEASTSGGGGGNAAALAAAAAGGPTEMSASFKNFRHHPDMENFYRFIFENDLRHEALAIIDEMAVQKLTRKMVKGAKLQAH